MCIFKINLEGNKCEIVMPGLAVGESMDLDSLLPPALSESLHIPPWLLEVQALSGAWLLSASETQERKAARFNKTAFVWWFFRNGQSHTF